MKNLMIGLTLTMSFSSFASVCSDLQKAEANIQSVAFYKGTQAEARSFCFFLSRAVSSPAAKEIGLDGVTMGSIDYCVNAKTKVKAASVAKEIRLAINEVPRCFSQIGQ